MDFNIAIEKPTNDNECFGVEVLDLPGCFSSGDTEDEAVENTKEAIISHIEILQEDGDDIPAPTSMEAHKLNPDLQDRVLKVIEV